MKKQEMSCVDCAVQNCNKMDGTYPEFCLTTHMDESVLQDAMNCYEEEENHKVMIAAAEVGIGSLLQVHKSGRDYGICEKIGAKKIGIATCVGLLREVVHWLLFCGSWI